MSLTSLLLAGSQPSLSEADVHIDQGLDALFRSNPAPAPQTQSSIRTPTTIPSNTPLPALNPTAGKKRKRQQEASCTSPEPSTAPAPTVKSSKTKPSKRRKSADVSKVVPSSSGEDEDDEDDALLEDSYLSRRVSGQGVALSKAQHRSPSKSSEEDDEDTALPVHESLTSASLTKASSKARKRSKYVPPDETSAQRDARTIFVGNVPLTVIKSKSSQKQLKRHFLSLIPGSKIESMRFRSVGFATATAALPAEETKTRGTVTGTPSTKQQRQQARAAQWRETATTNRKFTDKEPRGYDSETSERGHHHDQATKPSYLSPADRKRVAFIKGEFHQEVDTVNAYIVFAYTEPEPTSHGPEKTGSTTLHPFEAARLGVERCDGTTFLDRTIRVDRVGQWRVGIRAGDVNEGAVDMRGIGDLRATIFVGNLDFATKEEELRVWFEGVVSQERGPPGQDGAVDSNEDGEGTGGASRDTSKAGTEKRMAWVRSVRIVRDRDTQLGKGFAYVRFLDRECVDEILGLEPAKLKFAKRKIRVQRCKSISGTEKATSSSNKIGPPAVTMPKATRPKEITAPVPKGDPSLGAKLAGLSKTERKAAKAANIDRVKRRLAKKKVQAGVEKVRGGKVRERERHHTKSEKGKGKGKPMNKGRLRSEKSLEKRNAKK